MAVPVHDATVGWYWLPAVADPDLNPTSAEIGAGTRIVGITNYQTPNSEAEVDLSDIDDIYDTSTVGTTKAGPITLTLKRDDNDETDGWDLFTLRAVGFLMRSPFDPTPAPGAKVEVYPVITGQRRPAGYSRNTAQMFDVSFYVTDAPNLDAEVDGS